MLYIDKRSTKSIKFPIESRPCFKFDEKKIYSEKNASTLNLIPIKYRSIPAWDSVKTLSSRSNYLEA